MITGGANGIRPAAGRAGAAAGASVWIRDPPYEGLQEVAAAVGARGVAADVTDPPP